MLRPLKCTSSLVFSSTVWWTIVRSADLSSQCTCLNIVKLMTRVPPLSYQAHPAVSRSELQWWPVNRPTLPSSQLNTRDNLFPGVASESQRMTSGVLKVGLWLLLLCSQRKATKLHLRTTLCSTIIAAIPTTMAIETTMKRCWSTLLT
jgi:hypothetical protein